jgi:hypothetical protein
MNDPAHKELGLEEPESKTQKTETQPNEVHLAPNGQPSTRLRSATILLAFCWGMILLIALLLLLDD